MRRTGKSSGLRWRGTLLRYGMEKAKSVPPHRSERNAGKSCGFGPAAKARRR